MGVWYVTKAVTNHMKTHGIHGSIINIGSVNGDAIPAKSERAIQTPGLRIVSQKPPHDVGSVFFGGLTICPEGVLSV